MNHLGICMGIDGTRAAADKISKEINVKAEDWRESVQVHILLHT